MQSWFVISGFEQLRRPRAWRSKSYAGILSLKLMHSEVPGAHKRVQSGNRYPWVVGGVKVPETQ